MDELSKPVPGNVAANLQPETLAKWRQAGSAAGTALHHGLSLIKPGVRWLDVAEAVEARIRQMGAEPAFPTTTSVNHVAAHYTPTHDDPGVFREGDVVKLDVGAHVDGYIGDTAVTVEVGGTEKYAKLIEAARAALTAAVDIVGPNVNLSTIGAVIEKTITEYGYKPIQNLTGHSVERYVLHAGMSVPNVAHTPVQRPRVGQVMAIEPFATDGAGYVTNGPGGNIFHYARTRPVRTPEQRRLLDFIAANHPKLPFASRWCAATCPPNRVNYLFTNLVRTVAVKSYAALLEANRGQVAQYEHTVIITESGCEVLTLPKT